MLLYNLDKGVESGACSVTDEELKSLETFEKIDISEGKP